MNLLAAEQRGICRKNDANIVASDGESPHAHQPPSPSPGGEGVQGMRLIEKSQDFTGYFIKVTENIGSLPGI